MDVREETFEAWLLTERVRLRERAVEALTRLLAVQTKREALADATQTAVRLLALDPRSARPSGKRDCSRRRRR